MFTSRFGTTIDLYDLFTVRVLLTFSSAKAIASSSSLLASGEAITRERSLPLTCTGISISSAFASSSLVLREPGAVGQNAVLVADQYRSTALRPCAGRMASASGSRLVRASRTAYASSGSRGSRLDLDVADRSSTAPSMPRPAC